MKFSIFFSLFYSINAFPAQVLKLAKNISLKSSKEVNAVHSEAQKPNAKWDLELFSPAKINLFLRVIKKRDDGYHELASLFQTVAFGDQLYFSRLKDGEDRDIFTCNNSEVPLDSKNLVVRAINLYRSKTGFDEFFRVHLHKVIPSRAGMGGGSGDAATTLFAINQFAGRPVPPKSLEEWSAELGSDITFFLSSGTCYCTGRGEVLHPQPNMEPCSNVWLIKPEQGLSTPTVFKNLDYDMLSDEDPLELLDSFKKGLSKARFLNDLEPPAFKAIPQLKTIKEEILATGFETALMSGSGTTFFAIGSPSRTEWPLEFVQKWDCNIWRTEFINRPKDGNLWYKQQEPFDPPQ
mmetsp:Transcript_20732/g.30678  ORF Transcript_20732/g.30678 Transcript_20732/m.30678 type:complete len:350 (-) Transcript_20732:75-1124(-)